MEIRETIVGIKEINTYLVPYLNEEKPIPQENKLLFKFNDKLQAIDELFYAYLLLFRKKFPNVEIELNLNEVSDEIFRKSEYHKNYINDCFSLGKKMTFTEGRIRVNRTTGEIQQEKYKSGIVVSTSFIPHILVDKNYLEFERNVKNEKSEKWRNKIKEELKIAPNKNEDINRVLINNGIDELSMAELYFFNLFIGVHEKERNKKKNPTKIDREEAKTSLKNVLPDIFAKVREINFGLKELAKNIVEHTDDGFGVISARIWEKDRFKEIKAINGNEDFGGSFHEWFEANDKTFYLDINIIDAGKIGITEKYLKTIEKQKNNIHSLIEGKEQVANNIFFTLLQDCKNDEETITKQNYKFADFLDYDDKVMQQQMKKTYSRLGLLLFSYFVCKTEKGIMKISSTDTNRKTSEQAYLFEQGEKLKKDTIATDDLLHFVDFGTNYNCIIPIELKERKTPQEYNQQGGVPTSLLEKLFHYDLFSENKDIRSDITYIDEIPSDKYSKSNDKYDRIAENYNVINQRIQEYNNKIILIDGNLIDNEHFTSSDWVRLLSFTQFHKDNFFIVYGIDKEKYEEIPDIRRVVPDFSFENPILFYIKHEYKKYPNEKSLSLWFSSVLAGNSYDEYLALNRDISRYQHNLYSIIGKEDEDTNIPPNELSFSNIPFFMDDKLLNFELLIKDKNDNLTLFEQSAYHLLNLDIRTLPDNPDDVYSSKESRFFYNFKGFKVSDSHFSLGAKIHIKDYYYAKRMFYNSFYANRFAFLIAKYLLDETKNGFGKWPNEITESSGEKKKHLTLIGYSRYSELLVSNVRRLLELNKDLKNINHDVILEDDNALKNPAEIQDNVIIIIPIASTFSTSEKIEKTINKIRSKIGKRKVNITNSTVINVLCVVDKDTFTEQQYSRNKEDIDNLEKQALVKGIESLYQREKRIFELYEPFGWETKEQNNIIKLKNTTRQKYFIDLESEWNLIHDCKLCFPENPKDEKCLLETGANAVTPESIFSFPITNTKDCDKNIDFKQYFTEKPEYKSFIVKKHACRDNRHFNYYIKADEFFDRNKEHISTWLLENKKIEKIKEKSQKNRIVIITPSRTANSGFVNLVNQHVFSETATVLQYSDTDDILQNFIRFNASFFDQNSFIIFVDDVLHTATSLQNINDYIKKVPQGNSTKKAIDCCIVLFNRLGYFDKEEVKDNLSNVLFDNTLVEKLIDCCIALFDRFGYSDKEKIKNNLPNVLLDSTLMEKVIDCCIDLFNKLGYSDKEEVKNNLSNVLFDNTLMEDDRILAYANINLPPIHLPGYEFPLVKKEKFFETLSNSSVTDTMKLHFKEEKDKQMPYDFDKDIRYPTGKWDDLFHFYVFKALYGFFYGDFEKGLFVHENREWIKVFIEKNNEKKKSELFAKLKEYVEGSTDLKRFIDYAQRKINTDYSEEIENEIIYILATPPFIYYKNIREFAFYLVLDKLQKMVNGIKLTTDFSKYHIQKTKSGLYATPHSKFENFKHFLNLAADLKINYVFSLDMLNAIENMLNHWKEKEKKGIIYRKKLTRTDKESINKKNLFYESDTNDFPKTYVYEDKIIKEDFDIGFTTFYIGIVERLIKEDEAKAIKVIKNIVEYLNFQSPLFPDSKINSLRNPVEFKNQFVELLRNLVIENTFIFNTYIEEFEKYCEEKKEKFNFETEYKNECKSKIEKYYDNSENQAARQAALEKMLWDYAEKDVDKYLKEAFFKTMYLKELLKNDNFDVSDAGKISEKIKIILQYLSEILGMNGGECPCGGAYFTIRYNEKNKSENDISEDDLYTIAKYTIGNNQEDEIDTDLTADDTFVYQLYKGIKEKNSKKTESVIELKYDEDKKEYLSSELEEYHSDNRIDPTYRNRDKEEKWFETGDTFGKQYNNLLFLRITDIRENELYHEVLERYIDVFKTDNNDGKVEDKNKLLEDLQKCKNNENKPINEILDLHIRLLKSTKVIDTKILVQYLKDDANYFNFSLKTKQKLFDKLGKIIEEKRGEEKIKEILLEYNRYNDYISNPMAVMVFYKCNIEKCASCNNQNKEKNCHQKRFDPKRLRFLMLLRDDIHDFCKHHFENDSMRAFVEEAISNIKEKSYLHGTDEYEDLKKICFDEIDNTQKEQAEQAKLAINYLTNKRLLNNYLLDESNRNKPSLFNVPTFIDEINKNYKNVLNFQFGKYTRLDHYNDVSPNVLLNDNVSDRDKKICFDFLNLFMSEIIFELMYNIRKSILHKPKAITEGNPLIISLSVEKQKINEHTAVKYFVIANNKCPKQTNADKINRNIHKDKYRRDGLNLINNCLMEFYKENKDEINFHVEIENDNTDDIEKSYFKVYIPIKIIKNK